MFGKEFYPTPNHIIKKMIEPYKKEIYNLTILEPSAGKGNILDYIKENFLENWQYSEFKPYCIEINKELQFILQEKRYRLIAEDFLTYSGDYHFDLILMNPPFSNGDTHLLKAWEILVTGEICCLLNAETIENPYTEKRKLLKSIIDQHGTIEHLGKCFEDAENQTGVNVIMIRLKKVAKKTKFDFEFTNVSPDENKPHALNEETLKDPIATRDIIGNMVLQYGKMKEYFIDYLKSVAGINFYSQGMLSEYFNMDTLFKVEGTRAQKYNMFSDTLQSEIWRVVIDKIGMERYMTHQVRQNFAEFIKQQGSMEFTKENVFNLIKTLVINKDTILEQAIVDVFDLFTRYHEENRCHVEGWKTNSKWKVNRKIILPGWLSYGNYMSHSDLKRFGDRLRTNINSSSEYLDIDKVMCYITGTPFENCYTLHRSLDRCFTQIGKIYVGGKFNNTGESTFFNYKFWRKGTLHIEFKDKDLWEEFNMRACAEKKWLPDHEEKAWKEKKEKQTDLALF